MKIHMLLVLALYFCLYSCSHLSSKKNSIENEVRHFKVSDSSGEYNLRREIGLDKKGENAYVKTEVGDIGLNGKIIKKSLSLSKIEHMKLKDREIKILKPKVSRFSFDKNGVEFISQILLDYEKKKINLSYKNGQTHKVKRWQWEMLGNNKSNSIYCFYSQIEECIKVTGFLDLSKEKKLGAMNFNMIFDGDTYFEDKTEIKDRLISYPAVFEFEKDDEDGGTRYVMKFSNYEIDYKFDKNNNLVKKNWIAQGISIEER